MAQIRKEEPVLGGKLLGVGIVLAVMAGFTALFFSHVYAAQAAPELKGQRHREPNKYGLDAGRGLPGVWHASWFHHAGSGLLPFPRDRERASRMRSMDTCAMRHSLLRDRFCVHVQPWQQDLSAITRFFLQNAPETYETTGVAFLAVWIFQFAFADTCSTITSGAMIGRTDFVGDLLYSVGVTGFIYPIIGHWAWGPDGWLASMGSQGNFFPSLGNGLSTISLGSTVVHTIGGFIALAGAIVLGPGL